ncbi:MAG: methyltransferase domain-containing protein [Chloroflexi bacterium]|nr:MAG: methyltransferase domain-containing protein [Chloroflexota bacterium]
MVTSGDSSQKESTYVIDAESGTEMARLINQERLLTRVMGGVFPEHFDLSHVSHILDVGCGPGGWVLDVAFEHPKINVVGFDISQQMVEYARAHAEAQGMNNASFQVMNALESLEFDDNSFDVVNARYIQAFMMKTSWAPLMKEIMRILRPGGRLLLTDGEWSISNSPAFEKMGAMLTNVGTITGRSFSPDGRHICITPMLGRFLRDAGFVDIQRKAHALDFSAGVEDYGDTYQDLLAGLKLLEPFLVHAKVTTEEEFEELYQQALAELMLDSFCAVGYMLTVWGKKPA